MKTIPKDKREDVKVCFPVVDSIIRKKSSIDSINKKLSKMIIGPEEPLTEQRVKEIIVEINELIHQWPQLRVL